MTGNRKYLLDNIWHCTGGNTLLSIGVWRHLVITHKNQHPPTGNVISHSIKQSETFLDPTFNLLLLVPDTALVKISRKICQ